MLPSNLGLFPGSRSQASIRGPFGSAPPELDPERGITKILSMPRKIRQLMADLERAGFVDRGGKGSHRNYVHAKGPRVTLSGNPGDDAHRYQEKQVRLRIEESLK